MQWFEDISMYGLGVTGGEGRGEGGETFVMVCISASIVSEAMSPAAVSLSA